MNLLFVIGTALSEIASPDAREGITTLIPDALTASKYRLYFFSDRWVALNEDTKNGASIKGELVRLSDEKLTEIVMTEPKNLRLELIELIDGSRVLGAVGNREWLDEHALEITEFGSYVEYLKNR